ncbi:hypothetical protein [Butyricicoccus sp.]|uniref:hypothetical protein n=1 Tax=Butyricicoccus sp. TaxID=2049021 RepID=UPI003F160EBF
MNNHWVQNSLCNLRYNQISQVQVETKKKSILNMYNTSVLTIIAEGRSYRFTVDGAEQAAKLINERIRK